MSVPPIFTAQVIRMPNRRNETTERDPGPLARLEHIIAQPDTFPVVGLRLAEGETFKDIASAWMIPCERFRAWYVERFKAIHQNEPVGRAILNAPLRFPSKPRSGPQNGKGAI